MDGAASLPGSPSRKAGKRKGRDWTKEGVRAALELRVKEAESKFPEPFPPPHRGSSCDPS